MGRFPRRADDGDPRHRRGRDAARQRRIAAAAGRAVRVSFGHPLLVVATWLLVVVHLIEVLGWAVFFRLADAFANTSTAFYYALMQYTTVSSGIHLPDRLRLLGGMIAMSGLLTFARSTSVLLILVVGSSRNRPLSLCKSETSPQERRPGGEGRRDAGVFAACRFDRFRSGWNRRLPGAHEGDVEPLHGARDPFFGVKIEDLKKIRKRLKVDHALALELYDTGISDAMYLAGLIADDAKMSRKELQRWADQAYWYMLSEYTVPWVAAESPHGREAALEWIDAPKEPAASAGCFGVPSLALGARA